MTGYSHQAVGDFMALIMDNVIRRYMSEFGWYGSWDEGFQGSGGWTDRLPGKPDMHGGPVELRFNAIAQSHYNAEAPPGSVYLGDETVGTVPYYRYRVDPKDLYWPWVERVNDAFEGWRSLPDPADFDGPIRRLEQAVDELTPNAQRDGDYTFVNADVANAMNLLHKWVSPQGNSSSDLLYAFDAAYGDGRISAVLINQAQVAAGLGFTVAGEKQLWTKARQDIMDLGTGAAKALDITQGGGLDLDLKVVKAFIDLVGVFVPTQYQILTKAASAGVGFLDTILPKPTTESKQLTLQGDTADAMMSSLERMISDLENAIFDEELELNNRLGTLLDILGGDGDDPRAANDFHIHPGAGVDGDFTKAAEIRFNSIAVQDVGNTQVPIIAGAFLRSAEEASAETGEGIWTRDNTIGYGSKGPHARWKQVVDQFDKITTGTARELVEAGKTLAVAAGWIADADVEAGLAAQGLADELDRGQTVWNQDDVPA